MVRHPSHSAYLLAGAVGIAHQAFGFRTWYLSARDASGALQGILPLVEQRSRLFGHNLVSVPYFTYGGLLADSDQAMHALVGEAECLRGDTGAQKVELRHDAPRDIALPCRTDKVSMMLELPVDEAVLAKSLGAKLRSQIKRADREQVTVLWGGADLLEDFYKVFSESMRNLGTPVYSKAFFRVVLDALGSRAQLLVVKASGVASAVALAVRHGDRVEVPWAAATPESKRLSINMRMYWELLRKAQSDGASVFDFGRSSVGSGTYKFKMQWGAHPKTQYWHYLTQGGELPPPVNNSSPKFEFASRVWKKLPLPVANVLGPYIARNLP